MVAGPSLTTGGGFILLKKDLCAPGGNVIEVMNNICLVFVGIQIPRNLAKRAQTIVAHCSQSMDLQTIFWALADAGRGEPFPLSPGDILPFAVAGSAENFFIRKNYIPSLLN